MTMILIFLEFLLLEITPPKRVAFFSDSVWVALGFQVPGTLLRVGHDFPDRIRLTEPPEEEGDPPSALSSRFYAQFNIFLGGTMFAIGHTRALICDTMCEGMPASMR